MQMYIQLYCINTYCIVSCLAWLVFNPCITLYAGCFIFFMSLYGSLYKSLSFPNPLMAYECKCDCLGKILIHCFTVTPTGIWGRKKNNIRDDTATLKHFVFGCTSFCAKEMVYNNAQLLACSLNNFFIYFYFNDSTQFFAVLE